MPDATVRLLGRYRHITNEKNNVLEIWGVCRGGPYSWRRQCYSTAGVEYWNAKWRERGGGVQWRAPWQGRSLTTCETPRSTGRRCGSSDDEVSPPRSQSPPPDLWPSHFLSPWVHKAASSPCTRQPSNIQYLYRHIPSFCSNRFIFWSYSNLVTWHNLWE